MRELDVERGEGIIQGGGDGGAGGGSANSLLPGTERKIRAIFRIARAHGHDTLVLSAFGCGEFSHPPAAMAATFCALLGPGGEFRGAFRRVAFAILDDHHQGSTNYAAFRRAVGNTTAGGADDAVVGGKEANEATRI